MVWHITIGIRAKHHVASTMDNRRLELQMSQLNSIHQEMLRKRVRYLFLVTNIFNTCYQVTIVMLHPSQPQTPNNHHPIILPPTNLLSSTVHSTVSCRQTAISSPSQMHRTPQNGHLFHISPKKPHIEPPSWFPRQP